MVARSPEPNRDDRVPFPGKVRKNVYLSAPDGAERRRSLAFSASGARRENPARADGGSEQSPHVVRTAATRQDGVPENGSRAGRRGGRAPGRLRELLGSARTPRAARRGARESGRRDHAPRSCRNPLRSSPAEGDDQRDPARHRGGRRAGPHRPAGEGPPSAAHPRGRPARPARARRSEDAPAARRGPGARAAVRDAGSRHHLVTTAPLPTR